MTLERRLQGDTSRNAFGFMDLLSVERKYSLTECWERDKCV